MSFEKLELKLKDLYEFRKNYFLIHPIEDASLKDERINSKVEEIVESIKDVKNDACKYCNERGDEGLSRQQLANLCWIEGKARNASSAFDPLCQEMLTKALKLNPELGNTTDIHVQLGECFWKKGDKDGARLSFEQSLQSSQPDITKQGKRNLSILMRQVAAASNDQEHHMEYMEKSIKLVKEAIQIDFMDGVSWYILGNAHFSQFFVDGQKPETLKQALQAYKNAFKDELSNYNCDLLYNYGILLKFQEKYEESLKSLQLASKLDPVWSEAEEQATNMELLLTQLTDLIASRGGLKQKQFDKIVSKFDLSHLGPFSEPFKDPKTETLIGLKQCSLSELSKSEPASSKNLNQDKVCLLKVIGELGLNLQQPPYFCIASDSAADICAVSVFNAASNFHLQRGDSLAIRQPFITEHRFEIFSLKDQKSSEKERTEKSVNFCLIRVNSPVDLVVNGKKGNKGMQVFASVGVEAKAS